MPTFQLNMIRSKTCIIPSLDHLKACVADMIRDMPPPYRIVRQGVGVLTSAIAARVESKQVNGGGAPPRSGSLAIRPLPSVSCSARD